MLVAQSHVTNNLGHTLNWNGRGHFYNLFQARTISVNELVVRFRFPNSLLTSTSMFYNRPVPLITHRSFVNARNVQVLYTMLAK